MRKVNYVPNGQDTVTCPFCGKVIDLSLYEEDLSTFSLLVCEHLDGEDFATPAAGGVDVWFTEGGE